MALLGRQALVEGHASLKVSGLMAIGRRLTLLRAVLWSGLAVSAGSHGSQGSAICGISRSFRSQHRLLHCPAGSRSCCLAVLKAVQH